MSNVIPLGGYTKLDIEPDKVLDSALGQLEQVLVIGYNENGDNYFASSTSDIGKLLRMIETFKFNLMNGDFDS